VDQGQKLLFLRLFLAVSAAFCLLWQGYLYLDALVENRQQRSALVESTRHARDLLGRELGTFASDLKIVAQGGALRSLTQGAAEARPQAEADFLAFVREKPEVAQLRYLDRSGQEILRVDRHGDAVQAVTGDALQNKASRYYFSESVGLPAGRVYVSRIDLNVEHGAVEVPWRPVLRLAVPLHYDGGETAGVVIMNINVADFIGDVQRSRPPGSAPLELVNAEGYWLGGVSPDHLFGFMFGREITMAASVPQVWRQIEAAQSGVIEAGGKVYIFDTLEPTAYLDAESAAAGGSLPGEARVPVAWKIVGSIPTVSLVAPWRLDRVPIAVIALLVIAGICFAWSAALGSRRRSEANQKKTEAELVRVERLASLGGLVAGVAHELNTPIGNAVAVASTLSHGSTELGDSLAAGKISRRKLEDLASQLREGTTLMLRDLQRAARLIGNFKQVAVDQTSERRRRFRLDDLLQDVAGSLQPQFKNGKVALNVGSTALIELDGYAGPLSQVLINLVGNARVHAFDEGQAGEVSVATRPMTPEEVEIVVQDDGKGIPQDMLKRVFEPFFTTRLGAGGSGLGLSIAHNIVTNILGGTITVTSQPNAGTQVILRIPTVAPVGAAEQIGSMYDV
jgi:signal transduction histidine kinase